MAELKPGVSPLICLRLGAAGDALLDFVHDEAACNYPAGQTYKSMYLAASETWG